MQISSGVFWSLAQIPSVKILRSIFYANTVLQGFHHCLICCKRNERCELERFSKRTTSTRVLTDDRFFNFPEQIREEESSPSVAKAQWVPFLHKPSMVLPSRKQNCLQRDNTTSNIHEQRGLKQNPQFVMNMDYKLEPIIADKYVTNYVRNASTRFLVGAVKNLNKERSHVRTK